MPSSAGAGVTDIMARLVGGQLTFMIEKMPGTMPL
jgi:hypothetical protein